MKIAVRDINKDRDFSTHARDTFLAGLYDVKMV